MLRIAILAALLAASLDSQTTFVQVKAGALTCGAIRRAPFNGLLNVQTYCRAGTPVVSNKSSLITPGGTTIVVHTYGTDSIVWQFWDMADGNGTIHYQVSTDGTAAGLKEGDLP